MRPPKIDFKFLMYTSKNIYLKKLPFFKCRFTGKIPKNEMIKKIINISPKFSAEEIW